jgi:hypothetical protein
MDDLPVDFETFARLPGRSTQISARDLMANFRHLMDQLPEGTTLGQMLVWFGDKWEVMDPPTGESSELFVLTFRPGEIPGWTATSECE